MRMIREKAVVQLTYLPRLFPVNCYLVEEEDGLTLVDAALPNNVDAIMSAAARLGKPIRRIVLTHAHGDHIGALDGLKGKLPQVEVRISERDSKLLRGDVSLEAGEDNLPIRGGVPKNVRTTPDTLIKDGDRIGSLLAVSTPGHTPGSMSFLDERSGILIAGDALQTRGGVAVSGYMKLMFPFPALATWNAAAGLQSARKLLELNPTMLAVGHGNLYEQPVDAMRAAIDEAERRLDRKGA